LRRRFMKKAASILLVALMAAATLSGCQSAGASSDVIRIGVFEPLTGDNAAGGELEVQGIELANALYPEVLGKKVELVKVDNKSDKAEAATAAARLVEQDKVNAIIGSWGSSLSMAAGNIVKDA
jgi:branched-chain amino acid transport system substrate-binding protein